jgi:uncharacterized protein YkwD
MLAGGLLLCAAGPWDAAGEEALPQPELAPTEAPPPPPEVAERKAPAEPAAREFAEPQLMQYSIGEPTDEEQLYLELINRARANPAAEALRLRAETDLEVRAAYLFFGVNLDLMVQQVSAIAPSPPLALNSNLTRAARLHSGDMFTNRFQSHYGSGGSDPGSRLLASGYNWATFGENVYATSKSTLFGYSGFEVDWGTGPGGMQTPAGHRANIHNHTFREVGLGVVNGVNGTVGPQLVTQDFGTQAGATPFLTGVVFYDFNGNSFYDVGEGVGGVYVDVIGASYYARTANSGGYAVPVPGSGTYIVTFIAPWMPTLQRWVTVTNNANVKLDYLVPYRPPVLSGPTKALVGQTNAYKFNNVPAAVSYQWRQAKRVPFTTVEGAEAGLNNVRALISTNHSPIVSSPRASGTNAFRLAHPQPVDQFLVLNRLFRLGANSQLTFAERLGWATTGQVARAQITTNGGLTWQDTWSRVGNSTAGQTNFVRVTNSLTALAGREVQVRFTYDHIGGSYYSQTNSGIGFYVDDIFVSDAEELVESAIAAVTNGTSFAFMPEDATNYCLRVRGKVAERWLDWGPPQLPVADYVPLQLRYTGVPRLYPDWFQFDFEVISGTPGRFRVETASSPIGPWTEEPAVTIKVLNGSLYRAYVPPRGAMRFYRLEPK